MNQKLELKYKGTEIKSYYVNAATEDKRFLVTDGGHVIADALFTIEDAKEVVDEMSGGL